MTILLTKRDTTLEVIQVDGKRVRVRYLMPYLSPPIAEWYEWATLIAAGWREVKP